MRFSRPILSLTLTALLLSGCVAYWDTPLRPKITTKDGMYLVPNMHLPRRDIGMLFLTQTPEELAKYHGILLDEVRLRYAEGIPPLASNHERWLRESIQGRLERTISAAGSWKITDTPGPNVVRARLYVTEIEYDQRRPMSGAEMVGYVSGKSSGQVTLTLELRDSESRKRLAVFSQDRNLPAGIYWGPGSVQHYRVERAFYDFSQDMRHVIATAKAGDFPGPDERPPSPCKYSPFPICK